jgi:hypothetical protein
MVCVPSMLQPHEINSCKHGLCEAQVSATLKMGLLVIGQAACCCMNGSAWGFLGTAGRNCRLCVTG